MYRELGGLLGSVDRLAVLTDPGITLLDRSQRTKIVADLEEAVSLCREILKHLSSADEYRAQTLIRLGDALLEHHQCSGNMADLEEAVPLVRGVLVNLSSQRPDPGRLGNLGLLGTVLECRHERTGAVADLQEAIALHHEVLEMRPFPHPYRRYPLFSLASCLEKMYKKTRALPHLQEAILHLEELLEFHYSVGHGRRLGALRCLASLPQMRSHATGQKEDLARIASLGAEARQLEEGGGEGEGNEDGFGV
jgi:tetratricopeptide (TPR) repeat protein